VPETDYLILGIDRVIRLECDTVFHLWRMSRKKSDLGDWFVQEAVMNFEAQVEGAILV
jgi:hypothetical protein